MKTQTIVEKIFGTIFGWACGGLDSVYVWTFFVLDKCEK